MSDDQALKMSNDYAVEINEAKARLAELRDEMTEVRNQNNEMKSRLVVNDLTQTANDFQTNISTQIETIQENVASLSTRVSNNDQILHEIMGTLKLQSEALRQINETLNKQNETIPTLQLNDGNKSFMPPIGFPATETILLLGGYNQRELDSLLILENNTEKWKELNIKLPYKLHSHGAQFLNNNLYIFGGSDAEGKFSITYKLSKHLQWEKMADMNQKRDGVSKSSVILNSQIWVCGGQSSSRIIDVLKSVEMYDPEANTWKCMKEMNECRTLAAAAVVNGKIFCSGGSGGRDVLNSVECYDPSSDVWTLISNMPRHINGHGAVEMDGHFIVIGGYDGKIFFRRVWALNTADKNAVWIGKPSMSIPRGYFYIAKVDGKVFVCGENDSVEIFDGEIWRDGPNMPSYRQDAPAVVIPLEFARELEQFIADPLESSESLEE